MGNEEKARKLTRDEKFAVADKTHKEDYNLICCLISLL